MDEQVWQRKVERERKARQEAEALLESKSLELYRMNEELRSLAARLAEQGQRTQAIFERAAEGIVTVFREDDENRVESFNPAAERIFGCTATQAIGQPIERFIPDFQWEPAASGGQSETLAVRPGGGEFPLEAAWNEVRVDQRPLVVGLLRDITRRKQLEAQLAHAQKMESVGQLAAGIAHEINTPIQYVGDNARFLQDAFSDIDGVLDLYEQLLAACHCGEASLPLVNQIQERSRQIDLSFLRGEAPVAIQQSLEGTERVATIVRAMKEFSHPGVDEKIPLDLNHAIQSTITVSRNEWKYVAQMQTELAEDLPPVPCLPGDLNQAILNLIVNAAHAIEERADRGGKSGTISVRTRREESWAVVEVQDTGAGIPDRVRARIFDPFFTTKPVGKGTGQGLAIVYSVVVEKHGGQVSFDTELGVGTTFALRLPLVATEQAAAAW